MTSLRLEECQGQYAPEPRPRPTAFPKLKLLGILGIDHPAWVNLAAAPPVRDLVIDELALIRLSVEVSVSTHRVLLASWYSVSTTLPSLAGHPRFPIHIFVHGHPDLTAVAAVISRKETDLRSLATL